MDKKIFMKVNNKVEKSLKFLAKHSAKSLTFEYLYLVEEIMRSYQEYICALDSNDNEKAQEVATYIVSKISLEKNGILK